MNVAVVGTDTGVGKTVVTAALVSRLRADGHDARAVKPAQTGYPPDDDAAFVEAACEDEAAAICLERLEPALAPAVAAEETGADLSYDRLRRGCVDALDSAAAGVVEGIGGLRVPLAEGRDVVDLIADLDVPALVVARSGLGTLNHTALTVEALRSRDVPVLGVVCNEYEGDGLAERTNPAVMARESGTDVWTVPPVESGEPSTMAGAVATHLPESLFASLSA